MQNPTNALHTAAATTTTTPLMDVLLPAFSPCQSIVLVGDSVQSDGRFVLHTIATHVLLSSTTTTTSNNNKSNHSTNSSSSISGSVLWLTAGPYTPLLVANALRKMGYQQQQQQQRRLCIRSIPAELGERLLSKNHSKNNRQQQQNQQQQQDDDENNSNMNDDRVVLDLEVFTKQLYGEIKDWIVQQQQQQQQQAAHRPLILVILDDVSALAALLGTRLTYGLIQSLQAYQRRQQQQQSFGILLRCSQDKEQQQQLFSKKTTATTTSCSTDWIGAGGGKGSDESMQDDDDDDVYGQGPSSWESSLVELVDWVVGVVPLSTGYTREVHGRLILNRSCCGVATSHNTSTAAAAAAAAAPTTITITTTTTWSSKSTKGSSVGQSSSSSSSSSGKHMSSLYNYCLTENKALAIRVQSSSTTATS